MTRHLRVAIIGAGPAGIYAGNILANARENVSIDLFESLPAPYGLIRYGVAPDHPRIKGIVNSLHEMLDSGSIRLISNVTYGTDITLADLREHYHAVIFATGAIRDADLAIPGIDLDGSYGAADFVSWYDGHPDVPREWPLDATDIAVIGNGNVALDVARVLAKHPEDILSTDVPANVYAGLQGSPVTDVHVFGRRGPAHVKFTPIELRELGEVPNVDVVVYDEDFVFDAHATELLGKNNQVKVMTRTLNAWREREQTGAPRRLHLHFLHEPVEVYGEGRVEGIRFARTEPQGDGTVRRTDEIIDYPIQAVYRAVGYRGSALPDVPFDDANGVIPNAGGRVLDETGAPVPGLYATGWIKRGPVGLIGHTKGDALETITNLVADLDAVPDSVVSTSTPTSDENAILDLLSSRNVEHIGWDGWLALDAHERHLGDTFEGTIRERVKVVPREEQVALSLAPAGQAEAPLAEAPLAEALIAP